MPTYSDVLSFSLAEHATAAYLDPCHFGRWALDHDYAGSVIIERGSTQVGIVYGPEQIVIAARGSSQLGDWGENFLAFRIPWRSLFPFGGVHAGFALQAWRVAKEFRDTMRAIREHPKYRDVPVYVTGHSLGAALCPFLAAMLRIDGIEPRAIYTFESPRVGNEPWSVWYDTIFGSRTFRVVHVDRGCADIVTRVPPSILGWWHVGRPIIIASGAPGSTALRYESEIAWECARRAQKVGALAWWRVIARLTHGALAHKSGRLVEELRKIAEKPSKK